MASISLQDLRRRLYVKVKADKQWRFWGFYVHVAKLETLRAAYDLAKQKDGAPGIDGVTFDAIEVAGLEAFLVELRDELIARTYRPLRNRRVEIPKDGGKARVLGIPAIRDRVVQGALKLILEPIFEADFHDGSYGYRPRRKAHEAVERVRRAIAEGKTQVIDLDLAAYFDTVCGTMCCSARWLAGFRTPRSCTCSSSYWHPESAGAKAVTRAGCTRTLTLQHRIDPVEVDCSPRGGRRPRPGAPEYARYADDLVILVNGHWRNAWLLSAVDRRLREEPAKLDLRLNEEKSRVVDLTKGEAFGFLGFTIRRVRSRRGKWWAKATPAVKQRTALLRKLKEEFRRLDSQPVARVIAMINPILRGWVNYFRVGNAARCFTFVQNWVEKKVRRHLMRARSRPGFGWKRSGCTRRFGCSTTTG